MTQTGRTSGRQNRNDKKRTYNTSADRPYRSRQGAPGGGHSGGYSREEAGRYSGEYSGEYSASSAGKRRRSSGSRRDSYYTGADYDASGRSTRTAGNKGDRGSSGNSGRSGRSGRKDTGSSGLIPKKLPDRYRRYNDYKLLITILVLCCFGLVMVYSSSAYVAQVRWKDDFYFLKRQFAFMLLGIAAMLIVSRIDYHRFIKPWTPLLYLATIGLMILVDFTPFGVELNGQKRWLNIIPGVKKLPTYQPTELVKIAIILVFAYMINRCMRNLDKLPVMIMMILLLAIPAGLVLTNNLSSGIIIVGIGAFMYFSASRRKILYLVITVLAVIAVIVIYRDPEILLKVPFIEGYHLTRIRVWKDPATDPLNGGYQILQGLYAVGSGGLFGKGLGSSVQKQGFIPEAYNDMIFSIICEELGIFGAICVLGLFAYLIYRCIYIISRSQDLYGAMIVTGVMIQIALQTILNVAVVINAIPNTGVSLPFISYGGTSVAILLAEMGMVLSVARQIIYEKD